MPNRFTRTFKIGLTCLCTLVVCAAPALAQRGDSARTIRVIVCTPEGVPLNGATMSAVTDDGFTTKATPMGVDGVHVISGIGAKTTIELEHPVYGSTTSEVILPGNSQFVVLEVQMGSEMATARILSQRGDLSLLSAFAPAGGIAGGSNCCEPHGGLGCDDPDCEAIVCAIDPFCCDTAWDGICAGEAADLCGDLCGGGGGDCVLDCPGGALEEGEACGSDTNGGCNSTPPIYTAASCGDTFCGTAWASGGMRDTDWYLVDLPDPDGNGCQELRGTLTSQFDGVVFIVDGIAACAPVVVGETGTSNDCVTGPDAVACLPAPGTYVVFVATADFDGTPCDSGDNDYVLEISCADCDSCGGGGACPGEGDCCTPGGNGTPGCNDADCCNLVCGIDPFCCDVAWDGICADEAADLCSDLCGGGADCPGEGDCCTPGGNGSPGCDDADCCNLVCGIDPFCCDVAWDGICADEAADLCGDLCFIPPPANDDCADAIEVAIGSNTTGTTLGATEDANAIFCDTSVSVGGVWYSVTGDGSTMTASFCEVFASDCCFANGTPGCSDADCEALVCAVDPFCCDVSWDGICAGEAQDLCGDLCSQAGGGSADYDSKISVYCGDCEDLACVGGNDDTCGLQSQVTWCSQNGATYLIFVHGFSSAQGNFDLFVTSDGVPCDAEVFCLPVGGCCLPGGDCEDLTEADCLAANGDYEGDGTSCTPAQVYTTSDCANPFEDISGTGTLAPIASTTDDGGDAGIPIGFSFTFFGDSHNTVGVASNGYLTFGADLSDFTNDPVPTAEDPNDGIYPLWDDWSPNQSGFATVHYQTLGAAGSQRFIAQWTNVPHFNTGGTSTFQAVLFEGSNCVEFRYGSTSYVDPTVGIENQDGTDGAPGGFGPVVGAGDCVQICPEDVGGIVCELEASVDIKPGSCPNSFNRNSNGVLPVALVGTDDIDANLVDLGSLTLSRADGVGGSVSPNEGPPGPHTVIDDVATPFPGEPCDCHELTGDGIDDVSIKFKSQEVVDLLELAGEPNGALIELVLSGTLLDGTAFAGTDCIRLVPPGTPPGVLLVGSNLPNIWVDLYPLDEQLDEGGFTSFNRSFPQSTTVFLSVPVTPTAFPSWRLASYFIDGVEYPYTGNSVDGQMLMNLDIAGENNVLALKYKFYGSFQVPDFGGATQD